MCFLQVGHWEEALQCFGDMMRPGSCMRPTASTFNTIMSGFMKAGQYKQVGWGIGAVRSAAGSAVHSAQHTSLCCRLLHPALCLQ